MRVRAHRNPRRSAVVAAALAAAALLLAGVVAGCDRAGDTASGEALPEPAEALAPWAWEVPDCAAYRPEPDAAAGHRLSAAVASAGPAEVVTEVYEPGWGPRAVAEIRGVLSHCGRFDTGESEDGPGFREQRTVLETGFAGDESLLVEIVRLAPPEPMRTSYAAVVRDGDVVVTYRGGSLGATEMLCLAGASLATCTTGRT